jgi:hypothetical protein
MALIVEDGTGKADAESYISVADATAYHAARGNAAWATLASDTVREQLLRRATEYMLESYRQRWQGYRISSTQALDWPRAGVCVDGYLIAINIVPVEVQRACAELALKAATADLAADVGQTARRVKVGPIEKEYAPNASPVKRYRAVDLLLAPFLSGSDMNIKVVRA